MEPHEWSIMKKLIEKEMKCKVEAIFSDFDANPVGAASIGQVIDAIPCCSSHINND
jgi:predicted unusual protein kinase regulating ubiquinone biosynthesis (AarF/ABC1/UbiB family)